MVIYLLIGISSMSTSPATVLAQVLFSYKHAGVAFQAVTFADPGYGFSHFSDDPRITNILIAGDPIEQSPFALQGDVYQVVDYDFYSGGGSLHDMGLYYKAATFFNSQNDSIPQPSFGTDNTTDGINLYANIIHS